MPSTLHGVVLRFLIRACDSRRAVAYHSALIPGTRSVSSFVAYSFETPRKSAAPQDEV